MNLSALRSNLEERGYKTSFFETAQEASRYLNQKINGVSVGIGGSVTVQEMHLSESLSGHNQVLWHWDQASLSAVAKTDVYISSVNGLAETGEMINIDGSGNRISSTLFGHKKVYFLVGMNKIAPDYEKALHRARNVAAPLNAKRLRRNTPCAEKGDRCYDCKSPQRICKALSVFWEKPDLAGEAEVVLINQKLGF